MKTFSKNDKYFKVYACCKLVKGIKRSGICDIQRRHFDTIPNSLYNLLQKNKYFSYRKLILKYGSENSNTINEFFNWLEKKEYGFWCNSIEEVKSFPDINNDWEIPFRISNVIIDIKEEKDIVYEKILNELIAMGVPYIQLRAHMEKPLVFYEQLLQMCNQTRIKAIDIVTPYLQGGINIRTIREMCYKFLRIHSIVFYNSPENSITDIMDGLTKIHLIKQKMILNINCGNISSNYFAINKELFTESQHHNTCLNRKISIDVDGNIKNCPSMKESFGNIKDTTLEEALNKKGFKKYWNIKKDDIAVCKDCEFRHICTDCRAYLENPNDKYSKPLKCGYDPYTATWSEWSTNPLKQKAIEHYGMQELVKSAQVKKKKSE
ncbi:MAG: grasp-with-spasm system SPASM domain peptide maturase [Bacteroidia bacterium]|nr:grasp-with-spasm system SPASM domain peptide maturase [Bacteroidia bacterium]